VGGVKQQTPATAGSEPFNSMHRHPHPPPLYGGVSTFPMPETALDRVGSHISGNANPGIQVVAILPKPKFHSRLGRSRERQSFTKMPELRKLPTMWLNRGIGDKWATSAIL